MSAPQFTGILAAVVTPLTADGSAVDAEGIRRQAEHIIGGGIHGLVPGGSTGEFTKLSLDERKRVTEVYVEAAAGRVPVVAGTGALSTADTVELSVHAEKAGASAVMIVPPFYDAPTFDETLGFFGTVSDAIDIPIMYYNIPSATGVNLATSSRTSPVPRTRGGTTRSSPATEPQGTCHDQLGNRLNRFPLRGEGLCRHRCGRRYRSSPTP